MFQFCIAGIPLSAASVGIIIHGTAPCVALPISRHYHVCCCFIGLVEGRNLGFVTHLSSRQISYGQRTADRNGNIADIYGNHQRASLVYCMDNDQHVFQTPARRLIISRKILSRASCHCLRVWDNEIAGVSFRYREGHHHLVLLIALQWQLPSGFDGELHLLISSGG